MNAVLDGATRCPVYKSIGTALRLRAVSADGGGSGVFGA